MEKKKIFDLFNKLSYDTLESLETIMDYSCVDKEVYFLLKKATQQKYEENLVDFEGRNEYDNITRIQNIDLSEIDNNMDNFSKDELIILKDIIETGIKDLSPIRIENSIKPILEKYRSNIYNNLPEYLLSYEIEEFLDKLSILELDAIYAIIKSANLNDDEELDIKLNNIYSKKRLAKWKDSKIPIDQIVAGIYSLQNNLDKFNVRELKFIEEETNMAVFNITNEIRPQDIEESYMIEAIIDLKNTLNDRIEYSNKIALTM